MKTSDFERLKALLDQTEKFPIDFTLKFIGKNTSVFKTSVASFEAAHPKLGNPAERVSSAGNHIALTYVFQAGSSTEIIAVLEQVAKIEDILVML